MRSNFRASWGRLGAERNGTRAYPRWLAAGAGVPGRGTRPDEFETRLTPEVNHGGGGSFGASALAASPLEEVRILRLRHIKFSIFPFQLCKGLQGHSEGATAMQRFVFISSCVKSWGRCLGFEFLEAKLPVERKMLTEFLWKTTPKSH